jgi:nitrite reductase/ring-hydroxylating ferredoxin subunit
VNEPCFERILPLDELRPGRMHACRIGTREVVICRTDEGVFALDDICTHAEARMSEGRLRGTRLVCPLHGAVFDVRDGRVLKGPAVRSLGTHAVRIRDGAIEVAVDSGPDA